MVTISLRLFQQFLNDYLIHEVSVDAALPFSSPRQWKSLDVDKSLRLSQLKDALREGGLLWVSYPKGNQLNSDISRDSIIAYARSLGLKAVTQVSV
jgi:hypothetical protein